MSANSNYDEYFRRLMGRSWRGALYRRHWLYRRIAKRLRGRALDLGCGIGDMLRYRPETVGVDVNPNTVDFCRKEGLHAHRMELNQLPFDDKSFDSVLMDNVLEHIAEPALLLGEVRRVLRFSGRLVVGVPGYRGYSSDPDHKVFYDERGLQQRLASEGFQLREFFYTPLVRSRWLDQRLRQYCIYGVFELK
jgi:SAM-dependent methyltransferase